MANKREVIDVVVNRRRWYRGQGGTDSALRRREDGLQCCLGFACRASGKLAGSISGVGMPYELDDAPGWVEDNASVLDKMAQVNDDHNINDASRERELIELGNRIGLRLSFVD